jgi:hypothetical protein
MYIFLTGFTQPPKGVNPEKDGIPSGSYGNQNKSKFEKA